MRVVCARKIIAHWVINVVLIAHIRFCWNTHYKRKQINNLEKYIWKPRRPLNTDQKANLDGPTVSNNWNFPDTVQFIHAYSTLTDSTGDTTPKRKLNMRIEPLAPPEAVPAAGAGGAGFGPLETDLKTFETPYYLTRFHMSIMFGPRAPNGNKCRKTWFKYQKIDPKNLNTKKNGAKKFKYQKKLAQKI